MHLPLHLSLERHVTAATLIASGSLCRSGADRAAEALDALPRALDVLRVDLRSVASYDVPALAALVARIDGWRRGRRTSIRITFPGSLPAARDRYVARPCGGRYAARASSRHDGEDRVTRHDVLSLP